MTDSRKHKFNAVLVYKWTVGAGVWFTALNGIQELGALGIRFIAISQGGLDTDESNTTSKLLLHILASVAEFERSLTRERVSAGIKAAQKAGTHTVRRGHRAAQNDCGLGPRGRASWCLGAS
jgi:hypothetical protein